MTRRSRNKDRPDPGGALIFLCALVGLALLVSGCGIVERPVVVERHIVRCPPEEITKPVCEEIPPEGSERDQKDVFGNERCWWRRSLAWELGWGSCEVPEPPK